MSARKLTPSSPPKWATMPERRGGWPGPPRPKVSFRLEQPAVDWIDRLAAQRGEHRSDTIRALLAYAMRAMPDGWKPDTPLPKLRRPPPRADEEPFHCQLAHRAAVMVTDSTYEEHVKRMHPAEAKRLGWLT